MLLKKIYNLIFSIIFIWGSSVFNGIFIFSSNLLIAKHLGVEHFGYFYSIIVLSTIVGSFAGFGLPGSFLNIFSQEGNLAKKWISALLKYLFATSFLAILIFILFFYFFIRNDDFLFIFLISFNILTLISVDLGVAKFQLENKSLFLGIWQLLSSLLKFIFLIFLFYFCDDFNVNKILLLFSFVSLTQYLLMLNEISKLKNKKFKLNFNLLNKLKFLNNKIKTKLSFKKIALYGLISFFYLFYSQSNILIAKNLIGDEEAGLYAIAYTFILPFFLLSTATYQKYFLPKFIYLSHNNTKELLFYFFKINKLMIIISIFIILTIWSTSSYILNFLFNEEYILINKLLILLSVCIPLRFLSSGLACLFSSGKYVSIQCALMFWVSLVNFFLNLFFINFFGIYGAAYVAIITEFLIFMLFYIYFRIYFLKNI